MAQPFDERQLDDLALIGRQVGQSSPHSLSLDPGDHGIVGERCDLGPALGELLDPVALRLLLADPVDRSATSDRDRPCRHRGLLRIETGGVRPDLYEHFLRHLLGHRRITQHTRDGREHHRCHGVVDLGEGILVAVLHPLDERREIGGHGSDAVMMPGFDDFFDSPAWSSRS